MKRPGNSSSSVLGRMMMIVCTIIASCCLLQLPLVVDGFGIVVLAPLGRTVLLAQQSRCTTALSATTTATTTSLFDRIGGRAAVTATVDAMYERILGDSTLAPFFQETDMVSQKKHQTVFLTIAFGGMQMAPDWDMGVYIQEKHGKSFTRGLNETHFDAVAGHVVDSLKSLAVSNDLIDEVVGVLTPLRPLFVTKN